MRKHRGAPVNNDMGQTLNDPLKHGSGAAPQAAAAGAIVPAESVAGSGSGPVGAVHGFARAAGAESFGAPMNARLRRQAYPRTRQALAPLRTAMWAAYPPAVA